MQIALYRGILILFQGTYDPCMFEASKIRRATELKVPFLQCDKYFHTLSLTEVQGIYFYFLNIDISFNIQVLDMLKETCPELFIKVLVLILCKRNWVFFLSLIPT